jgi:hypothetical protein
MRKLAANLGALGLVGCVSLEPQGAAPSQDAPAPERARMERHVDASLAPRLYSVRVRTPDLERASRFCRSPAGSGRRGSGAFKPVLMNGGNDLSPT